MDVIFGQVIERVSCIQRKSHVVQIVLTSWNKWKLIGAGFLLSFIASPPSIILIRLWILIKWNLTAWALSIAEAECFIHIKPDSIKVK